MAKKKSTSTRALTGTRVMTKQAEQAYMYWDDGTTSGGPIMMKSPLDQMSQWQGVENKAMAYYETYFDLSGYELDDLTVFIRSGRVQDAGIHTFSGNTDCFQIYDILSNERLTEEMLREIKANNRDIRSKAPNSIHGPLDYSQVIYGRYRLFSKNANLTSLPDLMLNCRDVRFGSGQATTVQKLWWYRIIVFTTTPENDEFILVPASTFVLVAEVGKEDDLAYIMRQKRSYELAQDL